MGIRLLSLTCLLSLTTVTAADESPVVPAKPVPPKIELRTVEVAVPPEKAIRPDLSKIADEASWTIFNASGEVVPIEGRQAVRLKAKGDSAQGIVGLAIPGGVELATGSIEID